MSGSLIHHDGRVLAALDASPYAYGVATCAGWAASRLGAPLDLLHVLDRDAGTQSSDLSGNLVLGDREQLLETLAGLDAERAQVARIRGRELLNLAADQVRGQFDGPMDIEARLRHGSLSETLLDLEPQVRLFVLGKRGEHADVDAAHLGGALERVVRAVHRPVLVASRTFVDPKHFLIAFDGSDTTRKCIEMVAASPLLRGLRCSVLAVGDAAPEGMEAAIARLRDAGFDPEPLVQTGAPETVITATVAARAVDLLVMGAYGHSRIRQLIVGSTTTQVLRSCTIPVLLLR